MLRWLLVVIVAVASAACGGDDGSTESADTTTTTAEADTTTATAEADEPDEDEADGGDSTVPDGEGSESCLLEPEQVADLTGVDGWEVTEVEPHPTIENRATCRYEADGAELVLGRLLVDGDALDAYYNVTTICEENTVVESPREVGFFTFVCTTDGSRLGAGTADDTLITLEVQLDGEEPADEVYFELMKGALGF